MANLQSRVDEKKVVSTIARRWRVVLLSVVAAVAIYGVVVGLAFFRPSPGNSSPRISAIGGAGSSRSTIWPSIPTRLA